MEVQPRLLLKKTMLHLFLPEMGKTEKSSQIIIQNYQNLFVNREEIGSTA